jgi:hypothetical protein
MGIEDLSQWVARLVRTGGGFPLRVVVVQLAPVEKVLASGTIWKLGADWDEDEPSNGKRSALVPLGLEEGIDCEDVEASSPFEKFILLCLERPQVVGSIASKAVELVQPAIDTAISPILETMIEQVSQASAEKTAAKVRALLEEMLEFEELEKTEKTTENQDEEDEQSVMIRRLELEQTYAPLETVEDEIEHCWSQRQKATEQAEWGR